MRGSCGVKLSRQFFLIVSKPWRRMLNRFCGAFFLSAIHAAIAPSRTQQPFVIATYGLPGMPSCCTHVTAAAKSGTNGMPNRRDMNPATDLPVAAYSGELSAFAAR